MIYTIYKITNIINNKVYIGFTQQNIQIRFLQHVNAANKNIGKRSTIFHKAIIKHGKENFFIEVLFQSKSFEDCLVMETHFIEEYKTFIDHHECNGYNTTTGGRQAKRSKETVDKWVKDVASKPRSEEYKKKMSERFKGENNPMHSSKGRESPLKNISKERKSEIGKKNGKNVCQMWKDLGYTRNPGLDKPETIEKMRQTKKMQGEKGELWIQSEEGRKNISEKRTGKKQPNSQKTKVSKALAKSYLIMTPDGKRLVVTGISKAGKSLGFDQGNLIRQGKTNGFVLMELEIDIRNYPQYDHLDFTVN